MKQCAKCREVLYCCRPCQVENWIIHEEGCISASCTAVNIVPTIVKEKKMTAAALVAQKDLIDCCIQCQQVQGPK